MSRVVEEIPPALEPAARAALAWINRERGAQFELSGLVDPEAALRAQPGESFELGLVLCQGDMCLRERVRVEPRGQEFGIRAIQDVAPAIPPLLDPPPGVRKDWLDQQLARHAFVVLVFYRGFW